MRVSQPSAGTEVGPVLTTTGDLIVRGAVDLERLAAGAAGTYLRGQGAGVIPAYQVLPTLPGMRAALIANQSIPTSVWTRVDLDVIDYDLTTDFDVVNHKWVCSESGLYIVCANVKIEDLSSGIKFGIEVQVNGNRAGCYVYGKVRGVSDHAKAASDIFYLDVADEIEMFVYHLEGANRNVVGGLAYTTYLSIHCLQQIPYV